MLTGKTALITGSTSGIGLGIARIMAMHGAHIVLNGFGDVEAAKRVLAEFDGEVGYHAADMSKPDEIEAMVKYAEMEMGGIDILVNNAGITRDGVFHKMSPAQWSEVIRVNMDSVFNMTRQVIEGMREREWGRIVNISSINGQKGQMGQTNYAAAKAGMIGFTKALALENARKGVTVNCICPGYIDTEMVQAVPETVLASIIAQIPVGRLGRGEEIADMVAFLSGEHAGFVTGSTLSLNGGQYMAG